MPQFVVIQAPKKLKRGGGRKKKGRKGRGQDGEGFRDVVNKVVNTAKKANTYLKKAQFAKHGLEFANATGLSTLAASHPYTAAAYGALNSAAQAGYGKRRRHRGGGAVIVA